MKVRSKVRLIAYSQELVNGEPIHVSSNCPPVKASRFEPAGHSFHQVALKLSGYVEKVADEEKKVDEKEQSQSYLPSSDSYSSSKGKKKSGEGKQQDHYALLGLANLRYLATEEQIRKSYRETALRYHPDKQAALILAEETEAAKQAKKDEIESHFKAVQEAYEALMDPVKRRIYDSTDEFDDEIPTDCAPQDFFKVFGPAFMRNGRWSVNQPVPSLGDDSMSIKEVDGFYNFWYTFKSWREFPHADEFDIEQAESRDHKRWMERQNAKLSEKARKEETVRVRSLVDNAYKKDPRIARRKEEEKAEKQRKKQAKYLAKKLQEEEAARAAEEEKRRKEEEDKRAAEAASLQKKAKDKEKKLLRKERARLRTVSEPASSKKLLNVSSDDVESLCTSFNTEQLRELCSKLEGKSGLEIAAGLREALGYTEIINAVTETKKEEEPPQRKTQLQNGSVEANGKKSSTIPFSSSERKEKPWGREEIELLRKGLVKYQKGTSRRWEVISEYIGTGRSVDEILKAMKTVLLQKPDSNKAFDSFLEKRKPASTIASPLSTREEVDGVVVPSPENSKVEKKETDQDSSPNKSVAGDQSPNNDSGNTANGGVESSSSDQDAWSAVQERALVQALKTFPKETAQRWERVAAAVPGKTMNQCKKKFASLKESFRSKKSAV